jgi:hypothetical protein
MRSGNHFRHSVATFSRRCAAILTIGVSSLAAAQAVPSIGKAEGSVADDKVPWRGSQISYGVAMSALSVAPNFVEPGSPKTDLAPRGAYMYNAYVGHRVGITPEWHFNDQFYLGARFFLSQEFTDSDTTTYKHEFEASDLWLDAAWAGWKEPKTGIKMSGTLRFAFPTSKASQAVGRVMNIGPGLNLSRAFPVMNGLILGYGARFTYRFNRFQTAHNQGPSIAQCGVAGFDPDCPTINSSGGRASMFDVFHGPSLVLIPHERVTIYLGFYMQYAYLPKLAPTTSDQFGQPVPDLSLHTDTTGPQWRNFWGANISVSYQAWDTVGFTLGAFSFDSQLDTQGRYRFPVFNRSTVVSIDMSVDIESLIRNIKPKEKS